MDTFLKRAFCDGSPDDDSTNCLGIDPIDHGYISDRNDAQFTLVLHGSYLVKINPQVPYLVDGLTPANTTEKISVYAQSRAFRALFVPFVLGDVGESVNRYSSQAVAIRAGWAYINYPFAGYFNNYTSYDDVRWILRKISQLTDQDWQQIVDAADLGVADALLARCNPIAVPQATPGSSPLPSPSGR